MSQQDRPDDSERGGRHMLVRSLRNASLWIAVALLAVNGLGWALASSAREPAYVVEPKLDPDLADLRERIIDGTHHGEPFELRLTNLEAEQGITWFVNRHPSIPFRYPRVEIHPETARKEGIRQGDWVVIESPRGKVRQRARIFAGIDPRVVGADHGWWFPERKGPGHGWDESNINILTDNAYENCDRVMGATHVRTLLCRIYPEK